MAVSLGFSLLPNSVTSVTVNTGAPHLTTKFCSYDWVAKRAAREGA